MSADLVVLLDVDNTLLDTDLARIRQEEALASALGRDHSERFWEIYEQVREELDLADFHEVMERFGRECPDAGSIGRASAALYDFPFAELLFPDSLAAIRHVASFATPVILSDGDQLFQRHKIRAAGLEEATGDNVLVYEHKEREIEDIRRRFPARHYVMVDDRARILAAMKATMGGELTSVMVCQGKYADEPGFPEADITIESIGGLLALSRDDLANPPSSGP